jgi:hypothetical protein
MMQPLEHVMSYPSENAGSQPGTRDDIALDQLFS